MTDTTTQNLDFDELNPSQSQPHVKINNNSRRLDALVPGVALAFITDLMTGPTNGSVWIVDVGAINELEGHDGQIAYWYDGLNFIDPIEGWSFYVVEEGASFRYVAGDGWTEVASGGGAGGFSGVKVVTNDPTTIPDETNTSIVWGTIRAGFVGEHASWAEEDPTKVVINTAGIYRLFACVSFYNGVLGSSDVAKMSIIKNADFVNVLATDTAIGTGVYQTSMNASALVILAEGDELQVAVSQTSGGAKDATTLGSNDDMYFSVEYIGPQLP